MATGTSTVRCRFRLRRGGALCSGKFTLSDLEASGADTVILDLTAADWTLTPNELDALQAYAEEGHTLLGEATIFQWKDKHVNNGLAPIFGLAEQPIWYVDGLLGQSTTYNLREKHPDAPVLLRNVSNPYVSSLYGRGQKPATKKWLASDLAGAKYVGRTEDGRNAITVYDAPATRRSIFRRRRPTRAHLTICSSSTTRSSTRTLVVCCLCREVTALRMGAPRLTSGACLKLSDGWLS